MVKVTIGYARVSSTQQNLDMQLDALKLYGVDEIYQEKMTGKSTDRPELKKVKQRLREGDTLVVWRLDRLGRTVYQLLELVEYLNTKGIHLVSLSDDFDTKSPSGKAFFVIASAFSEMENEIRTERIREGVTAARARGRIGGRPPVDEKVIETAKELYFSGNFSIKHILETTGISKATLYKYINEEIGSNSYNERDDMEDAKLQKANRRRKTERN